MPLLTVKKKPCEIEVDITIRAVYENSTVSAENTEAITVTVPMKNGITDLMRLKDNYRDAVAKIINEGAVSVAVDFSDLSLSTQEFKKHAQILTELGCENDLTVYLFAPDNSSNNADRRLRERLRSYVSGEVDEYGATEGWSIEEANFSEGDDIMLSASLPYPPSGSKSTRQERNLPPVSGAKAKNRRGLPHPSGTKAKCHDSSSPPTSLKDYIATADKCFREMLFDLIEARGMTDVECYKRANVDKRTFSKIRSNSDYRPSKPTAVAFAIALRLSLDETQALLATAGYTLSDSFVFDKIIKFFLQNGKYDIFEINEALYEYDQELLGSF